MSSPTTPRPASLKEQQVISALPEKKPEQDLGRRPSPHAGRQASLYASERGTSTIPGFRVDPGDGALALVGHTPTEQQPRGFAIDPTGRYLLAVGQLSEFADQLCDRCQHRQARQAQAISDRAKIPTGWRSSICPRRRLDFAREAPHGRRFPHRTGRRHLRRRGPGFESPSSTTTTFRTLYDAWLKYALLIFPDQHLTRDQQIAFAKRFGPLEFDMTAISNVKEDGTLRLSRTTTT